jgi:hypothetical protein
MNKDISYALDYHELTKHSEISIMTSRHSLDLGNRPIPLCYQVKRKPIWLMVNYANMIDRNEIQNK